MARVRKTIRTVYMNVGVPEDLAAKLRLELYSDLEGRVPHGALQEFFTKLLTEHFKTTAPFKVEGA